MTVNIKADSDYLFEISWEVCNQVGGIYTVVKSKAPYIHNFYGDNYFLIGPYFPKEAAVKFDKKAPPKFIDKILKELKKEGIDCLYGNWVIEGEKINTFLINISKLKDNSNEIKERLWDNFKIDSYNTDKNFDEFIIWGNAVGKLLEKLRNALKGKIVAHFHEYYCAVPLLHIKKKKLKIGMVFTTHATTLGRKLAGSGVNLYNKLKSLDPKKEAYAHRTQSKHYLEVACASNADVFTTVSEITSIEAKYLLKKKPDLVMPNGIDMNKFPTMEERAIKHNIFKNHIFEFLRVFFSPYYKIELKDSLIYFISGRYEFRNKGLDIFISALGKLNKILMKDKNSKTIIVIFLIPNNSVKGINVDLLQNKINYESIEHFVDHSLSEIGDRIISSVISQKLLTTKRLFRSDFYYQMKKKMLEFKRKGKPLLVTHNLENEDKDTLLKTLKKEGLNNSSHDKVKVIYYPIYLTGADGLIDLGYYDTIMGCHLGIFPSYYEPWGYTPVEAGALGVPAVTTDLAGFGRFVLKNHSSNRGIYVLKREKSSDKIAIEKLVEYMYNFSKLSTNERVKEKIAAKQLTEMVDWKFMVNNYIKAHNMALKKLRKR